MNTRQIGKQGEDYIAHYLQKEGYTIVAQNVTCRYGEVDIVACMGEVLAFVEVKARGPGRLEAPAFWVDRKKQRRIILTAQHYLLQNPAMAAVYQPRFDVAEVYLRQSDGFAVEGIQYIKGAFGLDEHNFSR